MAVENVPSVNIKGVKSGTPVTTIMNQIRDKASQGFKDAVPYATADNFNEYRSALKNTPGGMNEWANGLIERIGKTIMERNAFANPLASFKKDPLLFGSSVQEIYTKYIDAVEFDYEEGTKDVFKRSLPTILSGYHVINSKKKFPITIDQVEVNKSFVSWEGVNSIVDQVLGRLVDSFNLYEYTQMRSLFEAAVHSGKIKLVEVGDAAKDESAAKNLVKQARKYSILTRFPKNYTPAGVLNSSDIDETYLATGAEVSANIDVGVEAGAFNLDKVSFISNRMLIDEFTDSNIQGIMFNRNFFVVMDQVNELVPSFNGSNLSYNYWYHAQQIFSYSPFNIAIAFVNKIPDSLRPTIKLDALAFMLKEAEAYNGSGTTDFNLLDGETIAVTAKVRPDGEGKTNVAVTNIVMSDDMKRFSYTVDKTADAVSGSTAIVDFTVTLTQKAVGEEEPVTYTSTATQYFEVK